MRALSLAVLAVLSLFASPAWAVLQGVPSRDPNGLRRSVVAIENSVGELCSGVIVGSDLVLTAAHCVIDQAAYRVSATGRTFRPQRFNVVALAIHPTFVPGTTPRTQPGVDLALLKLDHPFGPEFLPLDPAQAGRIGVGDDVTIAGYGVLAEQLRRSARTLRQANLVSLGPVQVSNRVLIVVDQERLAETTGAGACRGDSGGPILAATQTGYQLYGITSWSSGALRTRGPAACGGLTAMTPVVEHLPWIMTSMRSLNALNGMWTRQ